METSTNYEVISPLPKATSANSSSHRASPTTKSRVGILTSPYCTTVKEFMLAMVASGYVYKSEAQLVDMAIVFTDRLIEKVGERL